MTKVNRRISQKTAKSPLLIVQKIVLFLKRLAVVCTCLGVLAVAIFYGGKLVDDFSNRPIATIIIEGDFVYLKQGDIRAAVNSMVDSSFINENIDHLQEKLEAMTWIDRADLARQWPDKLVVTLYEQRPIARWGNEGFLNIRGELVLTDSTQALYGLPELSGSTDDVLTLMQQYRVLTNILQRYDIAIERLEKNNREAWQATLDNGWQLMLGKGNVLKKMQRLTYLLDQQLIEITSVISVVDVRYANGVSVQWEETRNARAEVNKSQTMKSNNVRLISHKRG